jgi:hypothetical protein
MSELITGERLKEAMIAADIHRVDHHNCSLCGYTTAYYRRGDSLFFDAGCHCTSGRRFEERDWFSAANWINMQTNPAVRAKLMESFGMTTSEGG